MRMRAGQIGLAVLAMTLGAARMVMAQETTPPPQEEVMAPPGEAPPPPASTGPEWWTFSRSETRNYLIDVNSVVRTGDELLVMVARVPKDTPAGDFSHSVDQFGIQCDGNKSHVVQSTDVYETGEGGDTYPAEEDWTRIDSGSFDDAIHDIGCDGARPEGPSFTSVKAYIEAGRP